MQASSDSVAMFIWHALACMTSRGIFAAQGVGRLILSVACAGLGGAPSLDLCMAHFSIELTRLLGALLTSPEGAPL